MTHEGGGGDRPDKGRVIAFPQEKVEHSDTPNEEVRDQDTREKQKRDELADEVHTYLQSLVSDSSLVQREGTVEDLEEIRRAAKALKDMLARIRERIERELAEEEKRALVDLSTEAQRRAFETALGILHDRLHPMTSEPFESFAEAVAAVERLNEEIFGWQRGKLDAMLQKTDLMGRRHVRMLRVNKGELSSRAIFTIGEGVRYVLCIRPTANNLGSDTEQPVLYRSDTGVAYFLALSSPPLTEEKEGALSFGVLNGDIIKMKRGYKYS